MIGVEEKPSKILQKELKKYFATGDLNNNGGIIYEICEELANRDVVTLVKMAGIADAKVENPAVLWHNRLNHIYYRAIYDMIKYKRLTGINVNPALFLELLFCEDCAENKIVRKSIPKFTSRTRSSHAFQFIHTDICGKYGVLSRNGKSYMIVFVDDYSRAVWCYFIHHKSEALSPLKLFI